MLAIGILDDPAWYGPAVVTFPVQFGGDPFDPARNDVRVRFIGEKDAREERVATFDPTLGAWQATLFSNKGGRYRAVLVRNGKETTLEPTEGIVEVDRASGLGIVQAKGERSDRLVLDIGGGWAGVGANLGASATPEQIDALAKAGATWVRLAPPTDPLASDSLETFNAAMDAVAKNGLFYTLAVPETSAVAWRRYALARYGVSPHLVQWEAPADFADPWKRATTSSATPWPGLFENKPGPFLTKETDVTRIKTLRGVLDTSGWANWGTPRLWSTGGAKGVGESDRFILVAQPGAKLMGVPLADGDYDLTTFDPAMGTEVKGTAKVEHGTLPMAVPGERFFVLRRRL